MLEISLSIKVAPLTMRTYSFFQLKSDCDKDWSTELVPGNAEEEMTTFKTNLIAPLSEIIRLDLLGAKTEFGVVKDAELIGRVMVDIGRVEQSDIVFSIGKDLKVANVTLIVKVRLFFKVNYWGLGVSP